MWVAMVWFLLENQNIREREREIWLKVGAVVNVFIEEKQSGLSGNGLSGNEGGGVVGFRSEI